MGASVKFDASGNALNEDVGLWLKSRSSRNIFRMRGTMGDDKFQGQEGEVLFGRPRIP